MMDRSLVRVSNDDAVDAPGLLALKETRVNQPDGTNQHEYSNLSPGLA
jgi:hypothetical protein